MTLPTIPTITIPTITLPTIAIPALPTLPGVLSSANAAIASASAQASAAAATLPSFDSLIASVKSGSIFKSVSSQLGAMTNIGIDTSSIASTIAKAQSTAAIDIGIAQAALAQATKQATANGVAVSPAQISAAMAPLGVLNGIQGAITSAVSSVSSAVSTHASALGASLSGLDPTASINAIAAKATAFAATVPVAPTAPTAPLAAVTVSGVSLPNPNYASQLATFTAGPAAAFTAATGAFNSAMGSFTAIAGNTAKIGALASIKTSADSLGASITAGFSGLASTAAAAKLDTLSTLKADAMLSMLTKPMAAGAAGAVGASINPDILTTKAKYSIIKAQETSVTQVVPSQQPPTDPIRKTETTAQPAIPLSIAEPKGSEKIWVSELAGLVNAINKGAYKNYMAAMGLGTTATKAEKDAAALGFTDALVPGYQAAKAANAAVLAAKPDPTTWTDEEKASVELYKANKAAITAMPKWIDYIALAKSVNTLGESHKIAKAAWLNNQLRNTLRADIQQDLAYYDEDNIHLINMQLETKNMSLAKPTTPGTVIPGYVRKEGFLGTSFG